MRTGTITVPAEDGTGSEIAGNASTEREISPQHDDVVTQTLADAANPKSLAFRFRSKRDIALREFLLASRVPGKAKHRIIDLGGGAAYWERVGLDWLDTHGFDVLCINHEAGELVRDRKSDGPVSLAVGDACNMADHADDSFDMVHSNSVIEHVGGWRAMSAFAREVRRLAPAYYVQTPNFWFPIDPHFYRVPFIHWLPAPLRSRVHQKVKAGWSPRATDTEAGMKLAESNVMLDAKQLRHLFPDARMRHERVAFLTKSLIFVRTRRGEA